MIMTAIVVILGFGIIFLFARRLWHRYVQHKFIYRLYELRDDLRRDAYNNLLDPKGAPFQYLDHTISKNIQNSYNISLFYILALNFSHYNDKKVEHAKSEVDKQVQENEVTKKYRDKIVSIIYRYVIDQHKPTMFLFKILFFPIFAIGVSLKKFGAILKNKKFGAILKDWVEKLAYFPETSDSNRFQGSF